MNEGIGQQPGAEVWADHYALIGEFVVKFEWINLHFRMGMQFMIEGIEKKGRSKVMALLADDSALSLLNSYRSVVLTSDHITPFGEKVINRFHSQVTRLIERRNEIIHGMLAVGWPSGSIEPTDQILGFKLKNRKEGTTAKQISISQAEFRALIQECEITTSLMLRIFKCYSDGGWEDIFMVTANSLDLKNQDR